MKSRIFEYEIKDNQIVITGVDLLAITDEDELENLMIPSEIDGLPVAEIASNALLFVPVEEVIFPSSLKVLASPSDFSSMKVSINEENQYLFEDGYGIYERRADGGFKLLCASDIDKRDIYSVLEGTVEIADDAFTGKRYLKSIALPASLKAAGDIGLATCSQLMEVTVDKKNEHFFIENEALFYHINDELVLKYYWGNHQEYSVPEKVTRLDAFCFRGAQFEKVVLPESVRSVSASAFKDCTSITQLILEGDGACVYVPQTPAYRKEEILALLDSRVEARPISSSHEAVTDRWQTFDRINTQESQAHDSRHFLFDYAGYDHLFNTYLNLRDHYCMAFFRLEYPHELSSNVKLEYNKFINGCLKAIMTDICERVDVEYLEKVCRFGFINQSNIDLAITMVNGYHQPKLMSFLLEYKTEHFKEDEFDFSL